MTGEEIKAYRKRLKLTQIDLAEYLGVTDRTIQRFEKSDEVPTLLCWAIVGLVNHLARTQPQHRG